MEDFGFVWLSVQIISRSLAGLLLFSASIWGRNKGESELLPFNDHQMLMQTCSCILLHSLAQINQLLTRIAPVK